MKYIYLCLALILVSGCAQKISQSTVLKISNQKSKKIVEHVQGFTEISQDVSFYTHNINRGYISSLESYEKMYFQPWNINTMDIPLQNAMWAYKLFNAKNSYGENLQPLNKIFFNKIKENSNFEAYSTLNKRAITLKKLDIRAFPTSRPVLRDPNKAGEGFPFDYMQNSTIAANKPIFVSHYSKDREWVFIKSSFAYGWVKSCDIVYIDKKETDKWQNAQQVFILKDNEHFYTHQEDF